MENQIIGPILPLRDLVVYPSITSPLFVGRAKSIDAINFAMNNNEKIIYLFTQKEPTTDDPQVNDVYAYGVKSKIIQFLKLPDNTYKVLTEGLEIVKIKSAVKATNNFLTAKLEPISINKKNSVELKASLRVLKNEFQNYIQNIGNNNDILEGLLNIDDPYQFIDNVYYNLNVSIEEKQKNLEITDINKKIQNLLNFFSKELNFSALEKKIKNRVKRQMEKTQREYYLNEQMKAIQKELGDGEDGSNEYTEIEKKINEVKLSKEAKDKALNEFKKLKSMSPMSAEASVIRNYLEWLLDIPWENFSKEINDIAGAEKILNQDHYGLEKVKERILEFLAVKKRSKKATGTILCFIGPPGVGKTSLGKSIARATGREFAKISLGGIRDEAEIRGHRRTYIGSMPGRFIQAMKKTKTSNPIILLDEIDKLGNDWRGDPSSALLEVLDPEQNNQFNDHYLEVDYDLSNVMFICTGNTYNIPGPLLDRLEVIEVSGYTEKEKIEIAKKYLIPRKMNKNILKPSEFKLDRSAVTNVVRHYTRESGVRGLEKVFDKLFRKLVFQLEKTKSRSKKPFVFDEKTIKKFLGPEKFKDSILEKKNLVGITNGLAWTQVGGDILNIEVNLSSGKGMIHATGKLGDVMKESITAALGYIKSNSVEFGVNPKVFEKVDIHLHVPEGAIPKDGPSAGITIFTSLISSLTEIKIKREVAMTGEITLKGRVLPIGGLKEKLLAAIRYGIKTVIIPKENEKDLIEIQKDIQNKLTIKKVEFAREVLDIALDGKISKINKKLDWRHIVSESMKQKNQQNQEKTFVN
ncbi:endopeptidase La [Alphaproteobacteria bacterium]|jgi:ATP-dependent Lon protease|nr:endopeptidase La [Alphaproteobacteria bacterium]MDB0034226.1 endopeptidase La [Alphaproteobacteria bacterium]